MDGSDFDNMLLMLAGADIPHGILTNPDLHEIYLRVKWSVFTFNFHTGDLIK